MTTWQPPGPGALDDTKWPETLVAKAILPGGDDDRLHGYAVLGDLARHYTHSDHLFLAVTGDLPEDAASIRFDVALRGLSSMSVNQAPIHAGVLSRICGGALASSISAGVIALGEAARQIVQQNHAVIAWATDPTTPPPASLCGPEPDPWVATLVQALAARGSSSRVLSSQLSRDAATLALLVEAGIRTDEGLQASIILARMSSLFAELLRAGPQDLKDYPVKLPPFHYIHGGAE